VCGLKACLTDELADSAGESLVQGASLPLEDLAHVVGLRMARRAQPVLDGQLGAAPKASMHVNLTGARTLRINVNNGRHPKG
jgi:hypothetical protein